MKLAPFVAAAISTLIFVPMARGADIDWKVVSGAANGPNVERFGECVRVNGGGTVETTDISLLAGSFANKEIDDQTLFQPNTPLLFTSEHNPVNVYVNLWSAARRLREKTTTISAYGGYIKYKNMGSFDAAQLLSMPAPGKATDVLAETCPGVLALASYKDASSTDVAVHKGLVASILSDPRMKYAQTRTSVESALTYDAVPQAKSVTGTLGQNGLLSNNVGWDKELDSQQGKLQERPWSATLVLTAAAIRWHQLDGKDAVPVVVLHRLFDLDFNMAELASAFLRDNAAVFAQVPAVQAWLAVGELNDWHSGGARPVLSSALVHVGAAAKSCSSGDCGFIVHPVDARSWQTWGATDADRIKTLKSKLEGNAFRELFCASELSDAADISNHIKQKKGATACLSTEAGTVISNSASEVEIQAGTWIVKSKDKDVIARVSDGKPFSMNAIGTVVDATQLTGADGLVRSFVIVNLEEAAIGSDFRYRSKKLKDMEKSLPEKLR